MRIDDARRPHVKIRAELQKTERGGREKAPARQPSHAAQSGDAMRPEEGAGPGRASALLPPPLSPDSPSLSLPHTGPRQF